MQVAFLTALLSALTISFSRGGKVEQRAAALIFGAAIVSPLLQTGSYARAQAVIAGVDMLLLFGLAALAIADFRRWLTVAIACQLLTVSVHLFQLFTGQLSRELYGLLTIIWAYPLLGSLAWGAWHRADPAQATPDPSEQSTRPLPFVLNPPSTNPPSTDPSSTREHECELLAQLLRNHGAGERAGQQATLVLARAGSLAAATQQPPERLRRWGADEATIAALALARDMLTLALRPALENRPLLTDQKAVLDYLRLQLAHRQDEQLWAYFLNNRRHLIGEACIAGGSATEILVLPRQVLRAAIDIGASYVILAHNHPSNHATPSLEDIRFTRKVNEALRAAGIQLIDHLIITRSGHSSLCALGYV